MKSDIQHDYSKNEWVNPNSAEELHFWSRALHVSTDELVSTIAEIGLDIGAIKYYLQRKNERCSLRKI